MAHEGLWNNIHQIYSISEDGKPNNLKSIWEQEHQQA